MQFADSGPSVRLYYERSGHGHPLLFISGTGSHLAQHPNVFDSPLPDSFDVVAFDHRDQGRSSQPDPPYRMSDYASDALAVLDAVGFSRAHVVGVSFGGMVAQELAIAHPERVVRLVLACTSSGGAGGSSYPLHELGDLDEDERLRAMIAISDTRFDRDWQRENPEQTAQIVQQAAKIQGRPSTRQLASRATHDTYGRLPRVASPTLVAAGRHDGIAPPANGAALAARIPHAELKVFEGGHLFLLQDPAAFRAIVAFLTAG